MCVQRKCCQGTNTITGAHCAPLMHIAHKPHSSTLLAAHGAMACESHADEQATPCQHVEEILARVENRAASSALAVALDHTHHNNLHNCTCTHSLSPSAGTHAALHKRLRPPKRPDASHPTHSHTGQQHPSTLAKGHRGNQQLQRAEPRHSGGKASGCCHCHSL